MDAPTAQETAAAANEQEQPQSLGFLQLQDAFKRMVAVGVDVVDEEAFARAMPGVPRHLLAPMWQLYTRVVGRIVENSMAEFHEMAAEVGLAPQMADLEALALKRGLCCGGGADGGSGGEAEAGGPTDDPASGPEAAAAAARASAKRAEVAALRDAVAAAGRARDDLAAQVDARRKAAGAATQGFERVQGEMAALHAVAAGWAPEAITAAAPAAAAAVGDMDAA